MADARLGAFVARVGLRRASERFGVSGATVQRWLRSGVSKAREAAVLATLRRSEASVKAAITARKLRARTIEIGTDFPLPPKQKPGENLTPEQLTPRRHPTVDLRGERVLSTQALEWEPIDSDRWFGQSRWYDVNQPYLEVDQEAWKQLLLQEWERSGRRWAQVKVFAATHVPYNPAYTGSAVRKRGQWRPFFVTSKPAETRYSVPSLIDYVFYYSRATPEAPAGAASIDSQAETRIVWIHRLQFRFFDSVATPPSTREILDRPMRPAPRRRPRKRRS